MKPTEIVEKYKYTIDLSLPLHILPKNQIKILVNDCSQDTKMLQIMKKSTNPILSKIN